jgi:hypothetical protein
VGTKKIVSGEEGREEDEKKQTSGSTPAGGDKKCE